MDNDWDILEGFGGPKGATTHYIVKYGATSIQVEIHPDGAVWISTVGNVSSTMREACRTYAKNWGFGGLSLGQYLVKVLGDPED